MIRINLNWFPNKLNLNAFHGGIHACVPTAVVCVGIVSYILYNISAYWPNEPNCVARNSVQLPWKIHTNHICTIALDVLNWCCDFVSQCHSVLALLPVLVLLLLSSVVGSCSIVCWSDVGWFLWQMPEAHFPWCWLARWSILLSLLFHKSSVDLREWNLFSLQAVACLVLIEHLFGPLLSMPPGSTHSHFVRVFSMWKSHEFALLNLWQDRFWSCCRRRWSSFAYYSMNCAEWCWRWPNDEDFLHFWSSVRCQWWLPLPVL